MVLFYFQFEECCDFIIDVNGNKLVIETKSVGSGVDIDELSEALQHNTTFLYQKLYETLKKEQNGEV